MAAELCLAMLFAREQGIAVSVGRMRQQATDNEDIMGTAAVVQAVEYAEASWDAAAGAVALADQEESRLQ